MTAKKQRKTSARVIDEEMDVEFVDGPLDGMRLTLHVIREEPRLTILARAYERQGTSDAEKSETECARREFGG